MKKIENKPESQEETQKVLTPEEAAIAARVASSGTAEWPDIKEIHDFSLSEDPMKLPDVFQKLQKEKKFVFRWTERKSEAIDKRRNARPPYKWEIVSSTTSLGVPFASIKEHIDPNLGCVCRLDTLLMYQPFAYSGKRHEIHEQKNRIQEQGGIDKSTKDTDSSKGIERMTGKEYSIGDHDEVIQQEGVHYTFPDEQSDSDFGDLEVAQ